MVEFALVLVPLVLLFLAVVQVAVYLHVRNVVTASAAEGARYAANADVSTSLGASRAHELAASALAAPTVAGIDCSAAEQVDALGVGYVVVRCSGGVPTVLRPLGDVLPLEVSARALSEGV